MSLMFKCDVCGDEYQHGSSRYEGHKLELYGDIFCCDTAGEETGTGGRLIAKRRR
jgi:hypothetical protein